MNESNLGKISGDNEADELCIFSPVWVTEEAYALVGWVVEKS